MPQLTFDSFFIQRRVIHEGSDGVAAPAIDRMEIAAAAAFQYRPVNALVEPLDSLPGDGDILFFPFAPAPHSR